MTKTSTAYGQVDIRSAHFLISYTKECGGMDWEPIAVLSIEKEIEDMRLHLLVHDVRFRSAIDEMQRQLHYFLHELRNPSPVDYLAYLCTTLSNVFGHIHYSFIEQIDKSNLFYFIITSAKLECIYNNVKVTALQRRYAELQISYLFEQALDKDGRYDADEYNKDLYYFYELLTKELPNSHEFHLADKPTIIEFSESIAGLSSIELCNILCYLKKAKLIRGGQIDRLLSFYCKNEKVHNIEK